MSNCFHGKYSDLCISTAYETEDGRHWLSGAVTIRKVHHLRRNRKTVPAYYCLETGQWTTDPREKFKLCQHLMNAQADKVLYRLELHSLSDLWDSIMQQQLEKLGDISYSGHQPTAGNRRNSGG